MTTYEALKIVLKMAKQENLSLDPTETPQEIGQQAIDMTSVFADDPIWVYGDLVDYKPYKPSNPNWHTKNQ